MKKTLLSIILLSLVGCSSSPSVAERTGFFENQNNILKFGDEINSIGKFQWLKYKIGGEIEQHFTIYLDKIPFDQTFDLCPKAKFYTSITGNSTVINTSKMTVNKEQKVVDCTTNLKVTSIKNGHVKYSLKMKSLKGYRRSTTFGELDSFPVTHKYELPGGYFILNQVDEMKTIKKDLESTTELFFVMKNNNVL